MFGANKNTTSLCMEENRIFFFYSSPLHVNVLIDKRMKSPRVIKSKTQAANLTLQTRHDSGKRRSEQLTQVPQIFSNFYGKKTNRKEVGNHALVSTLRFSFQTRKLEGTLCCFTFILEQNYATASICGNFDLATRTYFLAMRKSKIVKIVSSQMVQSQDRKARYNDVAKQSYLKSLGFPFMRISLCKINFKYLKNFLHRSRYDNQMRMNKQDADEGWASNETQYTAVISTKKRLAFVKSLAAAQRKQGRKISESAGSGIFFCPIGKIMPKPEPFPVFSFGLSAFFQKNPYKMEKQCLYNIPHFSWPASLSVEKKIFPRAVFSMGPHIPPPAGKLGERGKTLRIKTVKKLFDDLVPPS